jgi:hypothetical protein
MSNRLAIAAATTAFKVLLGQAAQAVPGAKVTSVRPDQIGTDGMERGINVFLYLATINASLDNQDTPMRRADGRAVEVPCTPLDLHYLLTFFGDEAGLEPQLLMGSTFAVLRRQPVLTAALIDSAIAGTTAPDLAKADLSQQVPRVKVTSERLDVELLHKLWPTYQCPYQLSVGFVCSPVLVESEVQPVVSPNAGQVRPAISPGGSSAPRGQS